jgi:hypothetical protein
VEETETGYLHREINEIVQRHIERDDPVKLPDLVTKVGESLILRGPEERWGNKQACCCSASRAAQETLLDLKRAAAIFDRKRSRHPPLLLPVHQDVANHSRWSRSRSPFIATAQVMRYACVVVPEFERFEDETRT